MLTPDELRQALTEAQKAAGVCKPWCRVVSTTEGGTYALAHNGAGSRDTDTPRIHNPGVTGLSKDGLTEKLRAWIVDLHSGNRIDLNATMATGGSSVPGIRYSEVVVTPDGVAIQEAWVELIDVATGAVLEQAVTGADGRFSVTLPPGIQVAVRAHAPGFLVAIQDVAPEIDPHAHSIDFETGTTGSLDHQHAVWTTCFHSNHLHLHVEGSCNVSTA